VALREVLAQFNIEVNDEQLVGLEKKLGTTQDKLAGFGRMLGAGLVFRAIKGFISDAAASGAQIERLSARLGIGTGDVQRFGYMAGQSGVDMEAAARAATFLEKSVGLAAEGNKAASLEFARLGVSVKDSSGHTKNFKELLPEVAEGISKLGDRGLQTEATVKLFGRAGAALLPMLLQGADGVSALSKEFDDLGIEVKGPALKNLEKLQKQFDANKMKMAALGMEVVNRLAPALMKLASGNVVMKLKDLAEHTRFVEMAMGGLALAATAMAVPALAKFGAQLGSLVAANPAVTLAIAGIVLLALALEDIYSFSEGKDSFTGDIITKWFGGPEEARKKAEELRAIIKSVNDALHSVGVDGVGDAFGVVIRSFTEDLKFLANMAGDIAKAIKASFHGDFSLLGNLGKTWDSRVTEATNNIYKDAPKPGAADGTASWNGMTGAGNPNPPPPPADTSAWNGMAGGASPIALPGGWSLPSAPAGPSYAGPMARPQDAPVQQTVTNTITVNTQPGADAPGIAKQVGREVSSTMKDNAAHLAAVQTGGR
jgi:hypothetical protein